MMKSKNNDKSLIKISQSTKKDIVNQQNKNNNLVQNTKNSYLYSSRDGKTNNIDQDFSNENDYGNTIDDELNKTNTSNVKKEPYRPEATVLDDESESDFKYESYCAKTTNSEDSKNDLNNEPGIEITIPILSNTKFRFFCKTAIVLIFILLFFTIHFDGYRKFKKKDNWTLTDARKMFFQGRFKDSFNCYGTCLEKMDPKSKDWFYYSAAKQLSSNKDTYKNIFFALPQIINNGNNINDELPTWIKEEIYKLAEKKISSKTIKKASSHNDYDSYQLYMACGDYKNSKFKAANINKVINKKEKKGK